ncbi:hypothetical protein LINGRAHAP2_LOCUS10334, partial [Linum grandiflorum]
ERTLHALSERSRIAPVRGTCSIHSRSASDHGADGAVETGNEHLPHVPQRGVNNSTGRCALDGLISFMRRAVRRVREEDELGSYSSGGLGQSPVGHMKDGGRVLMRWLHDNFYSCADVEDGPELRQYACAYMLSSIGAFLMPDRSSAYVHCQYLLIEGGPTSTSAGDIGGWMVLLQAWCLERFPSIARMMHERGLRRPQSRTPPLIARLVSIILN